MYSTKILKDSLAPCGKRLTTWQLTYPRFIHSELMTHRVFSRNSASSRAIPVNKLVEMIETDPVVPLHWGKNIPGMKANEELDIPLRLEAQRIWLEGRDNALATAKKLHAIGLHKQIANRVLEPWMFITVIVSATEFDNWFHLRNHRDAQPEIAWLARSMWAHYNNKPPTKLDEGQWHLPLVTEEEEASIDIDTLKKVSTGRCARVSYLTHDGVRDIAKDVELHDKLIAGSRTGNPLHMSPFEHVAQALALPAPSGNFIGFGQYRKQIPGEYFQFSRQQSVI